MSDKYTTWSMVTLLVLMGIAAILASGSSFLAYPAFIVFAVCGGILPINMIVIHHFFGEDDSALEGENKLIN